MNDPKNKKLVALVNELSNIPFMDIIDKEEYRKFWVATGLDPAISFILNHDSQSRTTN